MRKFAMAAALAAATFSSRTIIFSDFKQSRMDVLFSSNAHASKQARSLLPTLDVLSVGSKTQPRIQKAQKDTIGSHPAVRHFYAATEADDVEAGCHSDLTMTKLERVVKFCKSKRNWPWVLGQLRSNYARIQWLMKKSHPLGWLCAQKRPIDAFMNAVRQYNYRSRENLPDYLIIIDDDSWVNVDNLVGFVPNEYPIHKAHAVAGCMVRSRFREHNFTFGFGGFGFVFNRQLLSNFLKPLDCSNIHKGLNISHATTADDDFEQLACWRIDQNEVGEKPCFRDGMSVADLMHAYVIRHEYLKVEKWKSIGFCMHSDWVWGYFVNYYHLAVHSGNQHMLDVLQERLVGYNGSEYYTGKQNAEHKKMWRECLHGDGFHKGNHTTGDAFCGPEAHLCHRITPSHMYHLHNKEQNVQSFH